MHRLQIQPLTGWFIKSLPVEAVCGAYSHDAASGTDPGGCESNGDLYSYAKKLIHVKKNGLHLHIHDWWGCLLRMHKPATSLPLLNKQQGWKLLFDGKSHCQAGIPIIKKPSARDGKWKMAHYTGMLPRQKGEAGDICTDGEYENFDLKLQWKISKNGNSGVMFLVHESPEYDAPYLTGPEMQILDNDGHPDGKIHKHRTGDLYDLIASSSEPVHAVGEWNDMEIKLDHGTLSLFLNGVNTVTTTLWDANWDALVKSSKFGPWKGFAQYKSGHIDLQDHGFDVWFRNIRIKAL